MILRAHGLMEVKTNLFFTGDYLRCALTAAIAIIGYGARDGCFCLRMQRIHAEMRAKLEQPFVQVKPIAGLAGR
jgi:hypothetical protein